MHFTITLPTSNDPFGKWLEENGAEIGILCSLGKFLVTVSWCKVHPSGDQFGSWSVSRRHADFSKALTLAIGAAQASQAGKLTCTECGEAIDDGIRCLACARKLAAG